MNRTHVFKSWPGRSSSIKDVLNAIKQVYLQLKIGTAKKSLVVVVDQEFKFKTVIEEALLGVKVFAGTSCVHNIGDTPEITNLRDQAKDLSERIIANNGERLILNEKLGDVTISKEDKSTFTKKKAELQAAKALLEESLNDAIQSLQVLVPHRPALPLVGAGVTPPSLGTTYDCGGLVQESFSSFFHRRGGSRARSS